MKDSTSLHPVVTDMNEAKSVLYWCVQEMERRYRYMMDLNVRNIQSYNKQIKENKEEGIDAIYSPTEGITKISSKTTIYSSGSR